jgi:hypothetical protein
MEYLDHPVYLRRPYRISNQVVVCVGIGECVLRRHTDHQYSTDTYDQVYPI